MRRWMSVGTVAAIAGIFAVFSACSSFKNGTSGGGGGDSGSSNEGGSSSSGGGSGSSSGGSSGGSSGSSSGGASSSSGSSSGSGSGSGSGSSSGASDGGADGSATGAGPYGDLPSGYCCTSSADCRNRYCVDLGGGNKMCEDECDGEQSGCTGLLPGFTCTWDDAMAYGFCAPPSATTACVPADQFVHGTKATGACCTATGNGTSGVECLGGNCGAVGSLSNPYVCENPCSGPADCTGPTMCLNVGVYSVCVPANDPYTCQ